VVRLARVGDRSVAVLAGSAGDRVLDLGPRRLPELFAELDGIRDLVERTDAETLPPLDAAALQAPVVPRTMLCLGYNYRGHVPDGVDPTADDPATPDVFVKTPNTFGGPNDPVVVPAVADDVDYEGEIAVVIGRRAQGVALDDALSYVAGYTLLNDVSDRSWQRRQSQWALGKCFDGFAPLGPWLVTADEIDPQDLLVEVVRDGEVTVSQSTATTIFSVAFVVHYLSQVLTLEPGDVVSTGTPQKLASAQDAHRPLAPGDAVTVRVDGLGELTTTFIAPSGEPA
jgi:2-keto-4-pentenoate hydratase/2-oxohepta-3-ene-1,7-dioic acid hydratase in catechol pathway